MKNMLVRLTCITLLICLSAVAFLQAQDATENAVVDAVKAIEDGKLLRAITMLESLSEKHEVARQLLGHIYPVVGREQREWPL